MAAGPNLFIIHPSCLENRIAPGTSCKLVVIFGSGQPFGEAGQVLSHVKFECRLDDPGRFRQESCPS
jgi:hypothetical protein